MPDEHVVMVAIEDLATAGAVAAEAVRAARAQQATHLLLVHVLDEHPVVSGMLGLSGSYAGPITESESDGEAILAAADAVIRAEFAALGSPMPAITHMLAQGHAGSVLAQLAGEHRAELLVVGARRPHLFGRLTHPDVRAHIHGRAPCPVRVASLQETAPTSREAKPDTP